jgi:hypothetical protein
MLDLCQRIGRQNDEEKAEKDQKSTEKDLTDLSKMDFSLVQVLGLQSKKTSFIVTDPKLPSNPIVYASPGFVEMTGRQQPACRGACVGACRGACVGACRRAYV